MRSQKVVLGPVIIKEDFLEFKRSLLKEERRKTQKKILESEKKEGEENPPQTSPENESDDKKADETKPLENQEGKSNQNLNLGQRMIRDFLKNKGLLTQEQEKNSDPSFYEEKKEEFFKAFGGQENVENYISFLKDQKFLSE
jgi:hypothetical protein